MKRALIGASLGVADKGVFCRDACNIDIVVKLTPGAAQAVGVDIGGCNNKVDSVGIERKLPVENAAGDDGLNVGFGLKQP